MQFTITVIILGGIVGNGGKSTISNAYNLGKVDCTNTTTLGGIAGYLTSTITQGYYLKGTAQSGVGTNYSDTAQVIETETQMKELLNKNLANQTGWKKGENGGYPVLDF